MIAALYVRERSVYHAFPGVLPYPASKDATTYEGPYPVVSHPPCRAWGRYRHKAKPAPGEKELGLLAVRQVRQFGGVLEHPAFSTLFAVAGLPSPSGLPDEYGGRTYHVFQGDFGHRALKPTWLYCVGVALPHVEPSQKDREFIPVENMGKAERERTPFAFASFLISAISLTHQRSVPEARR